MWSDLDLRRWAQTCNAHRGCAPQQDLGRDANEPVLGIRGERPPSAATPDGGVAFLIAMQPDSGPPTNANVSRAPGESALGPARTLSFIPPNSRVAGLGYDPSGRLTLAWQELVEPGPRARIVVGELAGGGVGPAVRLLAIAPPPFVPVVALRVGPDGRAAVVVEAGERLFGIARTSAGAWLPPATLATDPDRNLDFHPGELQFDGRGRAFAGWTDTGPVHAASLAVP